MTRDTNDRRTVRTDGTINPGVHCTVSNSQSASDSSHNEMPHNFSQERAALKAEQKSGILQISDLLTKTRRVELEGALSREDDDSRVMLRSKLKKK